MAMQQEDRWDVHYQEILDYLNQHKQRPSKYHLEERHMLHWLKYNKKRMKARQLPENRVERLQTLLNLTEAFRRLNQYAYRNPLMDEKEKLQQLSLFDNE